MEGSPAEPACESCSRGSRTDMQGPISVVP